MLYLHSKNGYTTVILTLHFFSLGIMSSLFTRRECIREYLDNKNACSFEDAIGIALKKHQSLNNHTKAPTQSQIKVLKQ